MEERKWGVKDWVSALSGLLALAGMIYVAGRKEGEVAAMKAGLASIERRLDRVDDSLIRARGEIEFIKGQLVGRSIANRVADRDE